MKFIGINFGEFNSSVALCQEDDNLVGAPEERFTRQKKTKLFPHNALKYCLKKIDGGLKNISAIGQAWNPGAKWVRFNPLISTTRIRREDYFYTTPDNLYFFTERDSNDEYVVQKFSSDMPDIYYIKHHLCHAANAFFLSNFYDAAVLTADWQGELESMTKGFAEGNKITILDSQLMPHSLGMFYATYTEILGFQPNNDEWKVMAMSAEDIDSSTYEERILSTLDLCENGGFRLHEGFYKGHIVDQPNLYTSELLKLLDTDSHDLPTKKDDYSWQCKVAKAMQVVSEKIVWHILEDLHFKTDKTNLVLSGGFFMNSVLNGKILDKTKFENLYISYAPDDVGNSLGAALYLNHCIHNQPRRVYNNESSIGPKFSLNEIEQTLDRRKIKFQKLDSPADIIAQIIADGSPIALFQGKMEFGDRALGHRSILGDPRSSQMKDHINSIIKYRENFRPFAPATLIEKAHEIFDVEMGAEFNYMERVVIVREEWRKRIPAVTHFNGSGRLQTVDPKRNQYFYNIINKFFELTDIPVLLNTSFNINGEPIVLSPDDALNTFYNSGLEFLVIEDYLITKSEIN